MVTRKTPAVPAREILHKPVRVEGGIPVPTLVKKSVTPTKTAGGGKDGKPK